MLGSAVEILAAQGSPLRKRVVCCAVSEGGRRGYESWKVIEIT